MTKATTAVVWILLVAFVGTFGVAQGFEDAPATWGLSWPTVYTLRDNEIQVGFTSITSPQTLYVNLGVRDDLMVGLWPILLVQGVPNAGGKLYFPLNAELALALPVHVYYYTGSGSYYLHVGGVLGIPLGTTATLHAGLLVVMGRGCGWWGCDPVLYSIPSGILDLRLSESARALVEVEPTPFRLRVGVLARLFELIDLRVAVSLIPQVAVTVGVEGRVLLGNREPGIK